MRNRYWIILIITLNLVLTSLVAATNSTESAAPQPVVAKPSNPNALALLVGIDKYKSRSIPDLRGAVNDVENIRNLLVESFNFPNDDEHIKVLTNEQATRDAIINGIEHHLIEKANKDSIVVFHYSGHGSRIRDISKDEPDGYDETLVPYDSDRDPGPNFDVTDDELNGLLGRLTERTSNVTFIFDSCNSGTAVRAAGLARTVRPDDRAPRRDAEISENKVAPEMDGTNGLRGSGARYVLISGSATQEESYELSIGGRTYGALTWYLADQIRRAGANATYRDVMEIVRSRVTAKYPNQRPQLEGANADNFVFSAKSSKSAPYVIVTPMPADEVSLNVGEVHNASVGSVYDVYPPGTREFGEGSAVAQVTLVAVEPTRAAAKITKGGDVQAASRAVERTHHYPNPVLNVFIEGAPGSVTLQKIKAALSEYKHISVLSAARDYDLLLRETDGYIVTEGGDPTEISPRKVAVDGDTVSHVVEQVTGWAKYVNVLNIRNENPELKVSFEIDSSVALDNLTEGNEISIAIKNESNQNLYLVLLDLSSSGAITVVYGGGEEGIAPGYILHKRLRTTIPSGYESFRDLLKLIVTTEPADFGFIEQPPVTGPVNLTRSGNRNRNPLEELLASATIGTIRGAKMRVETGDWVTIEHAIEIRPNN